MLLFNRNQSPTLQGQIDDVLTEMGNHAAGTDEHDKLLGQLERLYKLRGSNKSFSVSGDAIVGALATIATTVIVLNYEQIHVVTSKAFGFIPKPKL